MECRQALSECGKDAEDSKIDECRKALEEGTSLLEAAGEDLYGRWLSQCKLLNTQTYAENATLDQRYALVKNSKPPTKVGSMLELFDCLPVINAFRFVRMMPISCFPFPFRTRFR
ncbi:MAG: hypothetical protein Ct9H90mP9_0370 [Pseudomonadota bacterium]|nr:MAG: hypothetical protein Ct9H90mP9_0370 [Pseudomonadota bacterium]